METNTPQSNTHQPVLLEEVLEFLAPQPSETYLDLTAGYGGHAAAILARLGTDGKAVLVDRDPFSVDALKLRFAGDERVRIHHERFSEAAVRLLGAGDKFDLILMDLGVSSPQLDNKQRGFSFAGSGPLDMRMDPGQETSAADIVNSSSPEELADILKRYGEEPRARAIARAIVTGRPVNTTEQLAGIVERTSRRRGKIHPATRTFQAIRIAVNSELNELESTLPRLIDLLNDSGRLVVISFHSLEDRLAKQFLREESEGYEAPLRLLTKKAISGSNDASNPRARSAKLRAAVKINTATAAHK